MLLAVKCQWPRMENCHPTLPLMKMRISNLKRYYNEAFAKDLVQWNPKSTYEV